MTEDRFEQLLRAAAQDYHRPPDTPREELWLRITAAREARRRRRIVDGAWIRWGVGIAAVLALGVGIGRWTASTEKQSDTAVEGPAREPHGVAYQLAAAQYLTRTEAFLTDFRARGRSGPLGTQFTSGARDLLVTTRLMLDSPAAADPRLRALLEELELVLAQITQLRVGARPGPAELDFITKGLEQRGVLTKLRTAIPAGPAVGAQGVL